MDRTHAPLRGDELLGCWQAPVAELITLGAPPIAGEPAPRAVPDRPEPPSDGAAAATPHGWLPVESDASTDPGRARR
ncbi:MAG TPA: hypothetical protein VFI28_02380 [Candidatus Limnocylindrales bacterium]|nr:hypothetical protein [Candidatus Limnocylindrales bacterium]